MLPQPDTVWRCSTDIISIVSTGSFTFNTKMAPEVVTEELAQAVPSKVCN